MRFGRTRSRAAGREGRRRPVGPGTKVPCGEDPKTSTVGARGRWPVGCRSGTVGPMTECDVGWCATARMPE